MNTETHDHAHIEASLAQLHSVPPRDVHAAVRGRGRFLAQAAVLRNAQPKGWLASLFSLSASYRKEKLAMVATFIVVLALLFGGSGVTAYAAQDSLPGEALYPVKTLVEDVRLELTSNRDARYELLDDYTTTRFEELDALTAAGLPITDTFSSRLLSQIDEMLSLAAAQSDEDLQETLDHIYIRIMDQDRLSWYDADLEGEGYGEVAQLREEITTRARLVLTGIENPVQFRLELENHLRYNQPEDAASEAPYGTPGGTGPGEGYGAQVTPGSSTGPTDPNGHNGSGQSGLTGTTQPYYTTPGEGGSDSGGQKGKP